MAGVTRPEVAGGVITESAGRCRPGPVLQIRGGCDGNRAKHTFRTSVRGYGNRRSRADGRLHVLAAAGGAQELSGVEGSVRALGAGGRFVPTEPMRPPIPKLSQRRWRLTH